MFTPKRLNLAMAVAMALGASAASAEIEISGHLKNETAFYTQSGQLIGEEKTTYDDDDHHGSTLKFENSARMFVNGEFGEESSFHLDLNLIYDAEGVESEYKGHENYTQNDWLREAYIDTRWGNTDIRIGKQQVVWGTADGIKLLDIINPTDFREFSQNTMEDSRIPIWMINVDTPIGETGSLQFILSEHEENKIPGLDKDGDSDHPYTVQGVDTITGEVNGFLNIAPSLANVATTFSAAAGFGLLGATPAGLVPFSPLTVDTFAGSTWAPTGVPGASPLAPTGIVAKNTDNVQNFPGFAGDGYVLLNALAQQGLDGLGFVGAPPGLGNAGLTNVLNETGSQWTMLAPTPTTTTWDIANPTSAFEHMPNATFATFNTFSGFAGAPGAQAPMTTAYVRDYPDDDEGNFGMRYKDSTDSGINWSVNYFYNYDSNPVVDLSYHDAVTGAELQTVLQDSTGAAISRGAVNGNLAAGGATTTVFLRDPATDTYYGAFNPIPFGAGFTGTPTAGTGGLSPNPVQLRFTETLERTHNLGGAFDMAIDNFAIPLVLRGEFLYKKDEMHPVVDKRLLAIGDLEGALSPEEHDMFKYVIGADVTVMRNLLISTQFIQFRNLDYQDDGRTCTTQLAGATTLASSFDCSRYTADAPTMSVTNSLQEAEENKEFISVFFTKPFGTEQQGRWSNITILEDTGGYWNRFDVEYGFTDNWVGSAELNTYWGDEDSWFGQLEETSNVQVGVKYIFD